MTTSSFTVYDYTTIGHMDLQSIYVLCIQYIYFSLLYTHISVQYIYLFISNVITTQETHNTCF